MEGSKQEAIFRLDRIEMGGSKGNTRREFQNFDDEFFASLPSDGRVEVCIDIKGDQSGITRDFIERGVRDFFENLVSQKAKKFPAIVVSELGLQLVDLNPQPAIEDIPEVQDSQSYRSRSNAESESESSGEDSESDSSEEEAQSGNAHGNDDSEEDGAESESNSAREDSDSEGEEDEAEFFPPAKRFCRGG